MTNLTLISHSLCPYVQRAAIALTEKGVPFTRRDIDLSNKPEWFLEVSPMGKTPVLLVEGVAVFESAVIVEYLEDTQPNPLHPADALARARHRGWIEVASAFLNDIASFYAADSAERLAAAAVRMRTKAEKLSDVLGDGPYFDGARFSLVDAAFGPVFRYFDLFDDIGNFGVFNGLDKVQTWRRAVAARPSVRDAVAPDYTAQLAGFVARRGAYLSELQEKAARG
ncbi:glutathione S-transferase [Actibacterium mucosum KCTC 23349]|uniref:glutathione transferase n=1 Tax=Actibacterium mucosum KCTC 23349 TaxID=1454373 RepID=A0A037ZIC4_9RHOB|nr:glutathione S-transferase family protein [Actibacterium mucosum]KAJ55302.1 glutathione S-transferase [Actibacterium mucosum KCTC 23349]